MSTGEDGAPVRFVSDPPSAGTGVAAARLAPRARWLIALGLVLYVLPLVARLPLIDPDEGLHAAIALDMVERGDFVVPRFLGEPFLDKPILFFAAQAASIQLFGANEIAVRLPGHLFGLLGAVTTGLVAAACAGAPAGVAAGAVYATLAFPLALNQAAVHDVALVPWTNTAVLCLLVVLRGRGGPRPALAWGLGAGVALGLAVLTKGLAGVALVGVPMTILVLAERRLTPPVMLAGAASLAVAALVALPWYLAVERAQPGYLHYFFVERHLLGFTTTTQMHGHRDWWYYLPVVAAGSVPWVATLPGAWRSGAALDPRLAGLRRVATLWLLADLAFLSAAGSKLATYVLPVFPAVASLVAVAWMGAPRRDHAVPAGRFARLASAHAVAGAGILPAATAWAATLAGVPVPMAAWGASVIVAAAWLGVARAAGRWPVRATFAASLAAVAMGLAAAYATLFPAVARDHTAFDLAAHFNRAGALPPQLWVVDERVGSMIFYLDPLLRRGLDPGRVQTAPLGRALLQGGGVLGAVVALPEATARRLVSRVALESVPFQPAGRYRLYDARALRLAPPRGRGPAR